MKVVGLLPVRNEEWVLGTTLPQLRRFVDEFVVLDGRSEDDTRALVNRFGGTVLSVESDRTDYSAWRQTLLEEARRRGGTHLVWLDADEAFTSNFLATFRNRLAAMRPGQKLALDWLCLWKDARRVRTDDCVWSRNSKDFVVCDDGISGFRTATLHEDRTPGPNNRNTWIRVPREEGAVLHFQFAAFSRFQMKQVFQRCREWVMRTSSPWEVNAKYAITLDDPRARTEPMPAAWLAGLTGLDALANAGVDWFEKAIHAYFARHGIAYFEPLDIWHIASLRDEFARQLGREPRPIRRGPLLPRIVNKLRRMVG